MKLVYFHMAYFGWTLRFIIMGYVYRNFPCNFLCRWSGTSTPRLHSLLRDLCIWHYMIQQNITEDRGRCQSAYAYIQLVLWEIDCSLVTIYVATLCLRSASTFTGCQSSLNASSCLSKILWRINGNIRALCSRWSGCSPCDNIA